MHSTVIQVVFVSVCKGVLSRKERVGSVGGLLLLCPAYGSVNNILSIFVGLDTR